MYNLSPPQTRSALRFYFRTIEIDLSVSFKATLYAFRENNFCVKKAKHYEKLNKIEKHQRRY
ncbi:MAG: hypothetical protein N2Z40_00945 [Caldimicrobium sp.]|nr:hypothetical protein [Caldimicrobium sp.]MCX7612780.1 hypothetical protein [Caldimicrobium sp.]MDW8182132.1 hypothetical protein [Caldimicrobium sp.]